MPQPRCRLEVAALRDVCAESFATTGPDLFGIEAEWPVHRHGDVAARPQTQEMAALSHTSTPRSSRVTFEPGGQIELSTAPATSMPAALQSLDIDTAFVHASLDQAGYCCADLALDGRRAPRRVLEKARYRAMESFFEAVGGPGTWMMNNTAATQVNLSHDASAPARRWFTLNRVAPLLIALFANSPGIDQQGRSWVSLRQAIWWETDPGRTRPVPLDPAPEKAWLEYALTADVAFVCQDGTLGQHGLGLEPGLTFGRWMDEGHECGWPTIEDFRYHLSMLFPPVRPRGWLEVRVLDALPSWLRTVACLLVATVATKEAGRELDEALPDTSRWWAPATRAGMRDLTIAAGAATLLEVVSRHLGLVTADSSHQAMLAEFHDRYARRGRMPGDDTEPVDLRAVLPEQQSVPLGTVG